MRRSAKLIGLLIAIFAIAAILAPSNTYADLGNFAFVGVTATVFPSTATLLVSFATVNDWSVNNYEVMWAAIPDGQYQGFEQTLESQKGANSSYLFSEFSPIIPGQNSFLFVKVVAHFNNGTTMTSDVAMVNRLVRHRPKPIDW
jgi:hypothetical protein